MGDLMAKSDLKKYSARRNTKESGEPAGLLKKNNNKQPIFVVQQHAASHMHYDFRVEIDGVLKSWAVPKGPSLNPKIKRLAVPTDDHPMAYANFEGIICEGNYGAGEVIVWDTGTYKNIKEKDGAIISMKDCFKRGTIEIELKGKKLEGGFALIRTHFSEKETWLLIKMKDDHADARRNPVATEPESVLSGKTIKDLKKNKSKNKVWKPNRKKEKSITKNFLDEDPKIKVGKYTVNITHPDKVIFPDPGISKQEVIDYYKDIAPIMLPYLKDRPLSMQRFVDGIESEGFYQKEAAEYFPSYIKRVAIPKEGGIVHYAVVNNAASLVYLANQLVITFHVWLSKTSHLHKPDHMIFDLDPSGSDFSMIRETALRLKKLLENIGLVPFVMTTGSRGLHVLVPLKPQEKYDMVREFAKNIASLLVEYDPVHTTVEVRKEKRDGKIFIDYLRNGFTATGVCPYSVRPRPGAPVATPLEWDEVSKTSLRPDEWNIKNIGKRLATKGDPWKNMPKYARSLKKARKKLETLMKE